MLNNNDIMKKLRVALKMRDTDIVAVLKLVDFKISPTELSAIFRREDHPHYRACGDQLLRRFLDGLIIHNRGSMSPAPDHPRQAPGRGDGAKVVPEKKTVRSLREGPRQLPKEFSTGMAQKKHLPPRGRDASGRAKDTIRVWHAS